MGKKRLKDPDTGKFYWVDDSNECADGDGRKTQRSRARPIAPPARAPERAPAREGTFDQVDGVDDWDLDDL